MFQCLKLLDAYVAKHHWGIQTICNILLQLSKCKQGSVISGSGKRMHWIYEETSQQGSSCVNAIHSFGACHPRSENKELNDVSPNVYVLLQ